AALNGRRNVPAPANWNEASLKIVSVGDETTRDAMNQLGVTFGDRRTLASLRRTVDNTSANPQARHRALKLIISAPPDDLYSLLRRLMSDNELSSDAILGLARFDEQNAAEAIVKAFASLTPKARAAAIDTLASRPSYAKILLKALETKQLARTDISAYYVRQMNSLNDGYVNDKLRELWGEVHDTPDDKRRAIENLKQLLDKKRLAIADQKRGKSAFVCTCASCHVLFGEGKKIGPELTGSNRKNLDYLIQNIVDPSAVVGAEFRNSVYILNDGRVLSGI